MHHIVYRTTNLINGRYYIGVHSIENLETDDYLGSGELLLKAISKYGRANFKRQILKECCSKKEAFKLEEKLVVTVHTDPKSYNMNCGGQGGWEHVNSTLDQRSNPMHNLNTAKKLSIALKRRIATDKAYQKILFRNLKKATIAATKHNLGRKRPEQAEVSRRVALKLWKDSGFRKRFHERTSGVYELTDPTGQKFETGNLLQFCLDHKISYSIIKIFDTGRKVKKGPTKGWSGITLKRPNRSNSRIK
jgi:hypothetical protein